jgi:hypothetical protein
MVISTAEKKIQRKIGSMKSLLFFFALLISSAFAYGTTVNAVIEPSQIQIGQAAELQIQIQGGASGMPQIQSLDGLDIQPVGQSSNLSFINGVLSRGSVYVFRIIPRREGVFTIPAISIEADGTVIKTKPMTLKVGKISIEPPPSSSAPVAKAPVSPPPAASTPANELPPSDSQEDPASLEAVTLQLSYPKRDFYVGELVPIEMKLFFRRELGMSAVSLPKISNSFTMTKLGKAEEKYQKINGLPYRIAIWKTAIAAVKAGDESLEAQMGCRVAVPVRRRMDPFGIFDESSLEERDINVKSPEAIVKVLPLPSEGKPASFSGAIGNFVVTTIATPRQIKVGDPITLKTIVSGTGNFDRVHIGEFDKSLGFKTYPPSVKFETIDESGYTGQKVFEQVLVPQSANAKEIPGVPFCFFDPETRKYSTTTPAAVAIQVEPVNLNVASRPPPSPSQTVRAPESFGLKVGSADLIPNKLDLGHISSMTPSHTQTWFWVVQMIPLLSLAAGWMVARHRTRMAQDPDFARSLSANRAIRNLLQELDVAMKKLNSHEFFVVARRVLQERLGQIWGIRAETITFSEIETRITNHALLSQLQKIFDTADAITYSGQVFSSESLHEWKRVVLEVLKVLETKKGGVL